MRFMMVVIPEGYEKAKPGAMPDAKLVAEMSRYNESLQKAGVLLSMEGLHPPSMGARVSFAGGKPKVTDGPFTEAKEVIGGYAILKASSLERAVEMAREFMELHRKHWPGWDGETEVRQVLGPEAFAPEA